MAGALPSNDREDVLGFPGEYSDDGGPLSHDLDFNSLRCLDENENAGSRRLVVEQADHDLFDVKSLASSHSALSSPVLVASTGQVDVDGDADSNAGGEQVGGWFEGADLETDLNFDFAAKEDDV
eukprot:c17379_g1_i4.p1 GENE.c17379_g1_i4~~c17379_g1_i4.p1  ORF type:complete len:124 (+),score=36.34 c17379_g1_i4:118-489(+)